MESSGFEIILLTTQKIIYCNIFNVYEVYFCSVKWPEPWFVKNKIQPRTVKSCAVQVEELNLKEPFVIWEKSTFIFNLAVDIWVQLCFHLFEMGSLNDNLKVEDY